MQPFLLPFLMLGFPWYDVFFTLTQAPILWEGHGCGRKTIVEKWLDGSCFPLSVTNVFWLCQWNSRLLFLVVRVKFVTDYWSLLAKRIGCESCFIEPVKTWRQYLLRKLVLMFEEGVTVPHFLNLEEGVYEKRSIETTKAPRVNPRHFDIQVTFHQSKSCGHITHFCRITSQLVLT